MSLASLINAYNLPLLQCAPTDFLDEAIDVMMAGGKNAVAVMEGDDALVGILTDHDIIKAVFAQQQHAGSVNSEHVFNWMTDKVITCDPETKLGKALELMGKHRIRHLVVVDGLRPVAVVSIRDILRRLHEQDELENKVLRDLARASRVAA